MDADGNLASLARYEKEQDAAERAYDAFIETVIAHGILERYEELRSDYIAISDKFNFDENFEDFIQRNF